MNSRIIKFRGRRFDNDKWVYGNLVIDDSGNCEIIDYESNREIRHVVDGSTIGQFTGLKDAQGQEIYEGDIIRSDSKVGRPGDMPIRHFIRYNDERASFTAVLIDRFIFTDLQTECAVPQKWISKFGKRVAGNIYSNYITNKKNDNG